MAFGKKSLFVTHIIIDWDGMEKLWDTRLKNTLVPYLLHYT